MANTSVFTGAHGTLTLALLTDPEGKDAESIINRYSVLTVGRVTGVQVSVQTDLEEFHEIGFRSATSLHPGNNHVSGTIERAYINGALVGLLLGRNGFLTPDVNATASGARYVQPAFNMKVSLRDPAVVGADNIVVQSNLNIKGVKFQNWSYSLPENDFVVERISFKALSVEIEDIEGSVTVGPAFVD
jgi:hypothetical protein